jgi:LysM repeat protein
MFQKPNSSILTLVILAAIALATVTIAGLFFLGSRSEPPANSEIVNVEGVDFVVRTNPNLRVRLVEQPAPPIVENQPIQEQSNQQTEQGEVVQQEPPPPTETPAPTATAVPAAEPVIFEPYTVQPNDTLFSIDSRREDTTIPLMARFGIDAADLVPGEIIDLPIANPAFCPGQRTYVVKEGDTAFRIAQNAGIAVETLRDINNFDENYTIQIAQVICLP